VDVLSSMPSSSTTNSQSQASSSDRPIPHSGDAASTVCAMMEGTPSQRRAPPPMCISGSSWYLRQQGSGLQQN
jgi:hypothetical protein